MTVGDSKMNSQITRAGARPGPLLGAVHEYRATGDLSVLRRALQRHDSEMSQMQAPERPYSLADAVYRGLSSFNLWPADADETCKAILDDMSDTVGDLSESDDIASAWYAVGEHLSYAIAKYATEHEQAND